MWLFEFLLLLSLTLVGTFAANTCPDESIIKGCSCRQTRALDSLPELICPEKENVDVAQLIQRLNKHANGIVLQFESLQLEKGAKVELTDNFFGNLTFRRVLLGTPSQYSMVKRVHPKAFLGPIASEMQALAVRSYKLTNEKDLFAAITVLKTLEYLAIEGRHLQSVPADAFTPLANCFSMDGCGLSKLKKINFTEGWFETFIFLTRIEQRAFANLPALEEINMSQQDVNFIGDYAFAAQAPTSAKLKIDLSMQWSRDLKPESFSPNSLTDINRPVELNLYGNQFISHLPESVFRPFLDANPDNRIQLGMKMNCSCEMYWLYAEQDTYRKHFLEWTFQDNEEDNTTHTVLCQEEKDLWQLEGIHFAPCFEPQLVDVEVKEEL